MPKKQTAPRRSPDHTKPDVQDQFPSDPNRASELGMTYGEAAPELPGKRAEPKETVTTVAPVAGPTPQQARKDANEKTVEKNLEQVTEKLGRRGRYG